jgi:hypothetical protein
MTAVPLFLVRLMQRPKLGSLKVGPEDRISIELAERLRGWSLDGRLNAVWTHPANEVGGGTKNAALRYTLAKALGMIPGTPDFLFIGPTSAVIEMKAPGGSLSDNQKDFRDWCAMRGVNHAVCRSADDAEAKLREWGILA